MVLALGIIGLCSLRMIRDRVLPDGSESSLIVLPAVIDLGGIFICTISKGLPRLRLAMTQKNC